MKDNRAAGWRRELRRAISWHRRLLAAGLAAGAVALAISALQPAPPRTTSVLAAARDLGGGEPLHEADVTTVRLPRELVPAGALRPPTRLGGVLLAAPMRRGEALTDARILGPSLLRGLRADRDTGGDTAGDTALVAAPVRLADADTARLVHAGDRVDILAADARPESTGSDTPARVVAYGAQVLAVPRPADGRGFAAAPASEGALLVLATTSEVAAVLARAHITARLSVTIRDS